MKNKIYRFVKWIVVINFVYLFIFENRYNIDNIIMKKCLCKNSEIVYFKIVMLIIITLIIMISDKIFERNSYEFNYSFRGYVKCHPIRSIAFSISILSILLVVFLIILNKITVWIWLIPILLIILSRNCWLLYRCSKKRNLLK